MKNAQMIMSWVAVSLTGILRSQIVKVVNIGKNLKMRKNRIVFLDIDGVLNSEQWYVNNPLEITASQIDSNAVKLLNQLRGASVVVTSSWGEDGGKTTEALEMHGLKLPIIGYTKKVHYQHEWACRGNEIEEWIRRTYKGMGTMWGNEYPDEKYEYVILDDDQDMLLGQANHFIRVDRKTGLTQEDIKKAKKILRYDICN